MSNVVLASEIELGDLIDDERVGDLLDLLGRAEHHLIEHGLLRRLEADRSEPVLRRRCADQEAPQHTIVRARDVADAHVKHGQRGRLGESPGEWTFNSVALWFEASNERRAFITRMGSPRSRTRVSAVLKVGSSVDRTVSKTRSIAVKPVSCQPGALAGTSSD